MCGIIGGISNKNITSTLIEGLNKLEYRGYDSSGLVVLSKNNKLIRKRAVGKVINLLGKLDDDVEGLMGLAHTRWATHGKPSEKNAHPIITNSSVSVVHNGIIENYLDIKNLQKKQGYKFNSETDTEVISHSIDFFLRLGSSFIEAIQKTTQTLKGSYGFGAISSKYPNTIMAARKDSPLLIGIGQNGNFIASDQMALLSVTNKFIFLEDGDIAELTRNKVTIYNDAGYIVKRAIKTSKLKESSHLLGSYEHFMQKEIFEQPQAIRDTLYSCITKNQILTSAFGNKASIIFKKIKQVQIVACGSSYNAGLVAKYWLEDIAKISCSVEVASEYRYRQPVILDNTLFVAISQSGETADILEALKVSKKINKKITTLSISNSAESSITRISDLIFLTKAGPEIGVASTKAFTTQLVSLALLTCAIGVQNNSLDKANEKTIIQGLKRLPGLINNTLLHENKIKKLASKFINKNSALFLGRGTMYAIALEGALKLKEISYIHAEAFPAGELKHGPIALIDHKIPVVSIAPNDELLSKLKSNLHEVKSRGSEMIVFEDKESKITSIKGMEIIPITSNLGRITAPIIFTIPLQLLAYHVALSRETDIDKPRNLAKSVTVE